MVQSVLEGVSIFGMFNFYDPSLSPHFIGAFFTVPDELF